MLFTSVRVRPWRDLDVFSSFGRVTRSRPSSRSIEMRSLSVRVSVPFGPFTVMVDPSSVTSTPAGTVIGRRPMRDMVRLPDVRQDLAAQLRLARLLAGHDPAAGAHDDDAEAAEHARDLGLAGIDAEPGLADALEPGDDRRLAVDVLEGDAEHGDRALLLLADGGDEALVDEDAGDLALRPRRGDHDLGVPSPGRVADAREHVC